jgi:uncharacterized protein (DUF305 family)
MNNNHFTNRRSTTLVALTAATLGVSLSLTACASGFTGMGMDIPPISNGEALGTANAVDTMFTTMMIGHHQQAIDMVDLLLAKKGVDAGVVALAERIKAAQAPEISQMESWLSSWGLPLHTDMDGMNHGDTGMMSDADMQTLEQASGSAAGRIFLEQMIQHHEGAIAMAQPVITGGADEAVISLVETIISSQTAEIAEMRALLATL